MSKALLAGSMSMNAHTSAWFVAPPVREKHAVLHSKVNNSGARDGCTGGLLIAAADFGCRSGSGSSQ